MENIHEPQEPKITSIPSNSESPSENLICDEFVSKDDLQKIRESIDFVCETGGKAKIYKTNSDDGVKITVKYLYDGYVHEKLLLIENVKKIKIKRETDKAIIIMCKKFKCKKVFMIVNKASEEISDIVSKI